MWRKLENCLKIWSTVRALEKAANNFNLQKSGPVIEYGCASWDLMTIFLIILIFMPQASGVRADMQITLILSMKVGPSGQEENTENTWQRNSLFHCSYNNTTLLLILIDILKDTTYVWI